MSPNDGVGLDDEEWRAPTGPETGKKTPKEAIRVLWFRPLSPAAENLELMAKSEVFEGEVLPTPEGRTCGLQQCHENLKHGRYLDVPVTKPSRITGRSRF